MSTRKMVLPAVITLIMLALSTTLASAHITRELTGTIGNHLEGEMGLAVSLETGNIYVSDEVTQTINIFNAAGGPPSGGIPAQITGLHFLTPYETEGVGEPPAVAIDNSCYEHEPRLTEATIPTCKEFDPSYGDLYVAAHGGVGGPYVGEWRGVEKFKLNSEHKYEETEEIILPEHLLPHALTVDPQGDVFVGMGMTPPHFICEIRPSGEQTKISETIAGGEVNYIAVDSHGDLYFGPKEDDEAQSAYRLAKSKLGPLGEVLSEEPFAQLAAIPGSYWLVAVNRATNNVFVGYGTYVSEYSENGSEPLMEFGSEEPAGGSFVSQKAIGAIAVNSVTGVVYIANRSQGNVDVFGPTIEPPIIPNQQPTASDATRTGALLAGTVDPEGSGSSYFYEYVPDNEYDSTATDPYMTGGRTVSTVLPSARADENIERVAVNGLLPGKTYDYRLVAVNPAGTSYGPNQTFTTAAATPPTAITGLPVEVGTTDATLTGTVGPRGLATSYVFEVGTSTTYGGARLYGNAGGSSGEVQANAVLQYLVPGMTYHYRLAATSFDGTTYGGDQTFTTPAIPPSLGQPPTTPLIATPTIQFPAVAGAITEPAGIAQKALTNAQKLKNALKECRRKRGKRRAACVKRVEKKYGKAR